MNIALQELLGEEPSARERWEEMADFKREMCLEWIAEAPTPLLREQRLYRLARRLWLTSFDPYYELASLMLGELDDLYGPPRPLDHLPPEEQSLALRERRVLGANHTRNYDDAGTWFRVVGPDDRPLDDIMIVYARPCVLTEGIARWVNYNGWETNRDAMEWLGLSEVGAPVREPLRVEDPAAGELRPPSERHTGPVLAVAVTEDGARAVSASADGTLRVWDAVKGVPLHVLAGHDGPVNAVALAEDGSEAISASADGTLRVWDVETGRPRGVMAGHAGEVHAVALLKGRQEAISASADGTLRVWDLKTGKTQHVLAGHTGPVLDLAVTKDGQRAVSASADGTLRVWNLATGRTRALLLGHGGEVRSVALLPDGQRAVSASADGTLRVWHLAGALDHILAGHNGAVTGVAVAPRGWDERVVYLSPGSLHLVRGVAAPGKGWGAVSASADGTLRMWDMKTGRNLVVFEGAVPFTCCAIASGGATFAAGDEQGQVHFLLLRAD